MPLPRAGPVAIVVGCPVPVVTSTISPSPSAQQEQAPQADCRCPCCLQETRAVFRRYDPDFQAGSLDEAYMDVTDYCQQHGVSGVLQLFHAAPACVTMHCNMIWGQQVSEQQV